jgi:hypothetical protein
VISWLQLHTSVLARVREELAGSSLTGSKRFIAPMQPSVNRSAEN